MPRLVLAILALLASCADSGPRDRSLMRAVASDPAASMPAPVRAVAKTPRSAAGLIPDHLAYFYPVGADVVVRLDDLATLERAAGPAIGEVCGALPGIGLPEGSAAEILRQALALPSEVEFDHHRPFAFVRRAGKWSCVVAASGDGGRRMRALEAGYAVAGDPEVIGEYAASYGKGHYLPGNVSLRVEPRAVAGLGSSLSEIFGPLRISTEFFDPLCKTPHEDVDRLDVALRFAADSVRVDVRAALRTGSPVAALLTGTKPAPARVAALLPPDGVVYVDGTPSLASLGRLLGCVGLTGFRSADPSQDPRHAALHAWKGESAAVLHVGADGAGTVHAIVQLENPEDGASFIGSDPFKALLVSLAGTSGYLEWRPETFRRHDLAVGAVTGYVARERIDELRAGNAVEVAIGSLLRGTVVAYVAVLDGKLCITVGEEPRPLMERFLDRVAAEAERGNPHVTQTAALFDERLAAGTIDFAALLAGLRDVVAARLANGGELVAAVEPGSATVGFALTAEGEALRLAVRVPVRSLAKGLARLVPGMPPK
ncbi:MAG: hypothetical protein ACREID_07510 [Planctomycetota bacterium]